jgi:flagellar biosynthesis protein FlhG
VPNLARLDEGTRKRLLQLLSQGAGLVDDVLVDTGAGLGDATLALQLAASRVVLVTTPEPTSLVDAYATLKVLWSVDSAKPVDLVVNAATDDEEAERAYEQISRASRHFLGHAPSWLGAVYRDPKVVEAVRRQKPVLELFPDCPAARCYERIALRLTSAPEKAVESDDYWKRLMQPAAEELPH